MRDIKFRAWDSEKMIYQNNMQSISWPNHLKKECAVWVRCDFNNMGYFELMQYTGLKDKNGKDIYEGDILKDLYGHHLKVVFDGGSFRAVFGDSICEVEGSEFAGYYPKDITEFFIVGNIYENTEMLK